MIFNTILIIVILFIVVNLFYDIRKIYNSGNFNLVEGYAGPTYPEKAEIPYNMVNTVSVEFNKILKDTIIPPIASFNVSVVDGSEVSVSSVAIDKKKLNLTLNRGIDKVNPKIIVQYTSSKATAGIDRLLDAYNQEVPSFTINGTKGTQAAVTSSDSRAGSWPNSFYGNFMGLYDSIMKIPTLKAKLDDDCTVKCTKCKQSGAQSSWCEPCRTCLHSAGIVSISGDFVSPSDSVTVLEGKAKYSPRDVNNVGADFSCPAKCALPNAPDGNCEFSIGEEGAYWRKCKKICDNTQSPGVDWSEMSESERKKQCWQNSDCRKCKGERYFPCNIEKGPDGKILKWDCTTGYERVILNNFNRQVNSQWDNRYGRNGEIGGRRRNRRMQRGGATDNVGDDSENQNKKSDGTNDDDDASAGAFALKKDSETSAYNSQDTDKNNYKGTGYTKNYKPQDPSQEPTPYNSIWSI